MAKRAVIFDFDGTLADSFDYVFDFLWQAAGKGYTPSKTEVDSYRNLPMRVMGRQMGMSYWKLLRLYFRGKRMMREDMSHVRPFPKVLDQVHRLHEADFSLYIVSSNSHRTISHFLDQYDLRHIFRGVYAGATPFGKGHLLRRVMRRHRLRPGDCWAVGDLMTDAHAAKDVGLKAIAVTWGFDTVERLNLYADFVVNKPADISKVILNES